MTFKKGRQYAEARRVSGLARTDVGIAATVTGSEGQKYQVQLAPLDDGSGIESMCNCDAWNKDGAHCMHVVAAGLVYLARVRAKAETDALASAPANSDDAPAASLPAAPASPEEEVLLPGLAKLENWLGLSAQPDIEFHYRLTPTPSATGGRMWIIDVRRADQAAKGPVQVKRILSMGTRVAPPDERVLAKLAEHEVRYDSKVVLNDEELADLFDVMKARRVIYRGTPLQFPVEPARPIIRLHNTPDGATAKIEIAQPDDASFSLKEVMILSGQRTWVLIGQNAYVLEPDFPPRMLRKWLLEPSMSFPPSQLDRVLSFFAAHLPRFRLSLQADGIDVDDQTEPQFMLTVEGRPDYVKAQLAAKYGKSVTVPVSPSSQHLGYASGVTEEGRKLYLRQETHERAAGRQLLERRFRFDETTLSFEASGDAALDFWARGRSELPKSWEIFAAQPPKVKVRAKLKPKIRVN
ncbi:MAG TPA: helicase, partial [Archangium sp.]